MTNIINFPGYLRKGPRSFYHGGKRFSTHQKLSESLSERDWRRANDWIGKRNAHEADMAVMRDTMRAAGGMEPSCEDEEARRRVLKINPDGAA
jgi:hypothetical protein